MSKNSMKDVEKSIKNISDEGLDIMMTLINIEKGKRIVDKFMR